MTKRIFILSLLLLSLAFCASPSDSTNADFSITDAPLELDFEADVNTTQYRSINFTNRTTGNYEIYNLAFDSNDCFAFSLHNVTNSNGDILYTPSGDTSGQTDASHAVSITVAPNETVELNLRFSPISCSVTQYTAYFIIYYNTDDSHDSTLVSLNANVNDSTVNIICNDTEVQTYNEEIGDPTPSRTLPALTDGQYYYLKVERMRAYLQPTGGFSTLAAKIGTDINTEFIRDEDTYQPPYLPITTDDSGNLTLKTIDTCSGFVIPSAVTDTNFLGASVIVSTGQDYTGTIERSAAGRVGEINLNDLKLTLYSNINNSDSLVQNDEGIFNATLNVDLSTAESEVNSYLDDITDEVDDDGNALLDIYVDGDNSVLMGSDLYHGYSTFVGVGTFVATDDTKMSGEAYSALIENEAYLFIQIDGRIVTVKDE